MPRCTVCKKKCDGKLVIVEPNLEPSHNIVCKDCFNLWVGMDFEQLSKRFKNE